MSQHKRTELDVRLETAFMYYTDSCCPKCGTPSWYGRSTDNAIQFECFTSVCYGCEALEREEANRHQGKNPPKRYGVTDLVRPVGVTYEATGESDPLPDPWTAMQSVPV